MFPRLCPIIRTISSTGRENEFSTLKAAYAVSHSQVFPASVFHVQWRLHPANRINREGIPFNFPSPCIVPATCNPEAGSSFSNLPSLSFMIGKIPSFAKCNIRELFNFIFYLIPSHHCSFFHSSRIASEKRMS